MGRLIKIFITGLLLAVLAACGPRRETGAQAKMTKQRFGNTADGESVELYTLTNKQGVEVKIMTYGAAIVSIKTPDRQGRLEDVVLGFDTLDGYLKDHPYFGVIIGRYGNRIGRARFVLDGVEYKLPANDGPNTLHGGKKGFDKVLWKARDVSDGQAPRLELSYLSRDGEEGFPGNLTATVVYSLTDANELRIDYFATTDKPTVVNLTNHSYFNLGGADEPDILNHELTLYASRYTPVDEYLIPTGELASVEGTPFDFRKPTPIGARIDQPDEQLRRGRGYDHNFVLDSGASPTPALAARVVEPKSGRLLEVLTTEPGIQFYSGNFLDGTIKGKGGKVYGKRSGFCLETQHFPDSPNKPQFPSTVLRPGEKYQTTTVFRFGVVK